MKHGGVKVGFGLVCFASVWALPARLLPVDEAAKDRSFLAFRSKLQRVVQSQDLDELMKSVDPNIRYSFGPCEPGANGFRHYWKQVQPHSDLWRQLGRVLNHGGAFDRRGAFVAPYVSSNWPKGLSAFDYQAVMGQNVPMRSGPQRTAPVLQRLNYHLVRLVEGDDGSPWVRIQGPSGGEGYVDREFLGSAVGYRASFEKSSQGWRMTVFIAGD